MNIHLELEPATAELLLKALLNEQARISPYSSTTQETYALKLNGLVYQIERLVANARLEAILPHTIIPNWN